MGFVSKIQSLSFGDDYKYNRALSSDFGVYFSGLGTKKTSKNR